MLLFILRKYPEKCHIAANTEVNPLSAYKYTAKALNGKNVRGIFNAESKEKFFDDMKERDLYLMKYEEVIPRDSSKDIGENSRIPLKLLALFCRQLSSLLKVGISLVKALDILYQQATNTKLKKSIRKMYESVQKGNLLSEGIKLQPGKYPQIMISLIESGESSGTLDSAVEKLAVQFEADLKLKNKVKSAMIYPAVIATLAVGVVVLMTTYVLPQFTNMFTSAGMTELPVPTRMLMGLSDIMINYWYVILFVLFAVVMAFRAFIKSEKGNISWNKLKFKLPVVKDFMSRLVSVRFCRTFSTLLSSGLTMLQSLSIVMKVVSNSLISKELEVVSEDIRKGFSLAQAIRRIPYFPPMLQTMVAIGEESGSLDQMLENASSYLNDELENSISKMISLIEPIMIVVMAGIVCFIILAVMLPMVQIYQSI